MPRLCELPWPFALQPRKKAWKSLGQGGRKVPVGHDSTCRKERRQTVWPYYVCVPRLPVSQSVSQFACLKLKNAELILTAPYTPFVTPDGKIETRYNNNKVADEGTCELIIRGCQKRLCCHVPTMVTKGRQSYEDTNCANDNSPLW